MPSTTITTTITDCPLLTSDNNQTWRARMEMLLIHEGMAFDNDALRATTTILTHLGESIVPRVRHLRDPAQLWDRLQHMHDEIKAFVKPPSNPNPYEPFVCRALQARDSIHVADYDGLVAQAQGESDRLAVEEIW
ncbi:MAG: hypothetical protein M1826_002348 [Phylliscum demangeonii]|nr:MAG: hypothetical protein M1826_002348 [Phylliscum demangeonii]